MVTNLLPVSILMSNNRGRKNSQPDINLRQPLPEPKRPLPALQMLLRPIQRLKQGNHIPLIRRLRRRKPTLIHPVIDQIILPRMRLFNLGLQILRIQIHTLVLIRNDIIKLGPKHAQDLAALVIHNRLGNLVIQHWHSETPSIIRDDGEVHIAQVGEALVALEWVGDDVLAFGIGVFGSGEASTFVAHVPVDDTKRNDVLEPFEFAGDQGAAGPWTGIADVEMVSAFFGGELGAGFLGDPVAEGALLALEFAGGIAGFDPVGDFGGFGLLFVRVWCFV